MRLLRSMVVCLPLLMPALALGASSGTAFIASTVKGGASNLPCSVVADRAQVRFRVHGLGSRPQRMQVFVNGELAPRNQIVNSWPTIELDGGLLPGRDTVELLVTTEHGRVMHHSQVVKIGDSVHSRDGIRLACRSEWAPVATIGAYGTPLPPSSGGWSTSTPVVVYPASPAYTVPYAYGVYPYGWYGNLSYGGDGGWVNYGWPGPYLGFGFRWGDDDDFHHFGGWRRGYRH